MLIILLSLIIPKYEWRLKDMYTIRRTLAVVFLVLMFSAAPIYLKLFIGLPIAMTLALEFEEFCFQSKVKSGGEHE